MLLHGNFESSAKSMKNVENCHQMEMTRYDTRRSLASYLDRCWYCCTVTSFPFVHFRNVFIQFQAGASFVYVICCEAKASVVESRMKMKSRTTNESEHEREHQPRMCKLHELQTMQL